MIVVALVVLALTVGVLAAALAVAEYVIRQQRETIRIHTVTERRLAENVRRLQEQLVDHAVQAQVISWWRNKDVTLS